MQQTKVTEDNREDFYKQVYPVVGMEKAELINLDNLPGNKIIIDSAGWYYEQHFPNQKIIKFEHLDTCSSYKFTKEKFNYIFTNEKIPTVDVGENSLIYDNGTYLKYKNSAELKQSIQYFVEKFKSSVIVFRTTTITLNDSRFEDRPHNLLSIVPDEYIVTLFNFAPGHIHIEMKLKQNYDFN